MSLLALLSPLTDRNDRFPYPLYTLIDLFGLLDVVPNSNLPGIIFFVYCICIIMWHSHLNDMEIPETKRFILKGFELGTTLS